jgi:hypothetical protein
LGSTSLQNFWISSLQAFWRSARAGDDSAARVKTPAINDSVEKYFVIFKNLLLVLSDYRLFEIERLILLLFSGLGRRRSHRHLTAVFVVMPPSVPAVGTVASHQIADNPSEKHENEHHEPF